MTDKHLDERKELTRRILEDAPRLGREDTFQFRCHPGISCFNRCCADVNIVLTPMDILRMSRHLGMTTSDFLAEHTFVPFNKEQKLPFVFLKMNADENKACPFVTADGCSIYQARPWPCRMYPIGEASPEDPGVQGEGFFFVIQEQHCKGHEERTTWSIARWMDDQGVGCCQEMGELFKQILLNPYLSSRPLDPARIEMFYMACYDLDKFRDFVFKSRFLDRFVIEPEVVEAVRSDDIELMRFAFRWLRFALFGEMTIEVNAKNLSERERDMIENKIKG